MLRPMAGRSLARLAAPLALILVGLALFMVLKSSTGSSGGQQPSSSSAAPAASATAAPKANQRKRRVYVVKPGDTPSQIAEKTGVTLEQLEKANPDLDPQLLAPGQRIKIPQ
jgi:LysM repeat protein